MPSQTRQLVFPLEAPPISWLNFSHYDRIGISNGGFCASEKDWKELRAVLETTTAANRNYFSFNYYLFQVFGARETIDRSPHLFRSFCAHTSRAAHLNSAKLGWCEEISLFCKHCLSLALRSICQTICSRDSSTSRIYWVTARLRRWKCLSSKTPSKLHTKNNFRCTLTEIDSFCSWKRFFGMWSSWDLVFPSIPCHGSSSTLAKHHQLNLTPCASLCSRYSVPRTKISFLSVFL